MAEFEIFKAGGKQTGWPQESPATRPGAASPPRNRTGGRGVKTAKPIADGPTVPRTTRSGRSMRPSTCAVRCC